MARTAPIPNIPAIPGMNPGIFILGGGGAGGGSGGGGGGGGKNQQGASGNNKDNDATGGGKNAKGSPGCGGCGGPHAGGVRGDPVDVVTGRVTSIPVDDFVLPGPLSLHFKRAYCSSARDRDTGLGHGWGHPFGWEIEIGRRSLIIWDEEATRADFPAPGDGEAIVGPRGWIVRRIGDAYELDTNDSLVRVFEALPGAPIAVLRKVRDRNGNTITIERDGRALRRVKDSAGRVLDVDVKPGGRIGGFVVTLPKEGHRRARLVTYRHDDRDNLVCVIDADGFEARYAYDDDHLMTAFTNRCGVTFHYVYDSQSRCVETWGDFADRRDPSVIWPERLADNATAVKGIYHYRFTFGDEGYSEVAGAGSVERFEGTPDGRIDKSVHGGQVATRSYDEHGYLIAVADGLGAVTSFERDARGRLLRATDPLGRITISTRDAQGDVLEVVDPAGGVSLTTYDSRGNALTHTEPDGATTSYAYDSRGLVVSSTEPNNAVSRMTYDEEGNWIELVTPEGGVWRRTFDGLGRKVSETDPAGATRHFTYSARGDLLSVRGADGGLTTYAYDGERLLTAEVDPAGARTEYEYGAHGKLYRMRRSTGAIFELRYGIDAALRRVVNELGEVAALAWDARGNLIEETSFDGRKVKYRYDWANRMVAATRESGDTYQFEYDAAGQLLKRVLPSGDAEELEYDALGRVIAATNAESACRFVRDAKGRILREEQEVGGEVAVIEATYGPTGEVLTRATSLGHAEELVWSASGRLVERRVGGTAILRRELDERLRERSRELSGGGRIQTAFDAGGRLAAVRVSSPSGPSVERRMQHDARGALELVWDSRGRGARFEHDVEENLVRVTHEGGASFAYSFDEADNLYEQGDGREYEAGGRLVRYRGAAYSYNQDGKLIEKIGPDSSEAWRYEWTETGRLRAVVRPGGERIKYAYDCFGRRLQKRSSSGAVRYVWDGDDLLHEITSPAGPGQGRAIRTYLFAPEAWMPVAHRDGAPSDGSGDGWLHYVTDDAGAPALLVSADGARIEDVERSPWGRDRTGSPTPLGMLGQYMDEDTGLAYNRFRYYNPETGRYISPDPLGLEGGANLYGYVPDPTRWADPLGLIFPKKIKDKALEANRKKNGGVVRCEECEVECVKPKKSMKGDTAETRPSMLQEWQADHIHPESRGGSQELDNCQILCRKCNRTKSDKL